MERALLERRRADVRNLDGASLDPGDRLEPVTTRGIQRRQELVHERSRHETPDLGSPHEAKDHGASDRGRQRREQTDIRPVRDELEWRIEVAPNGPSTGNRPMRHDAVEGRERPECPARGEGPPPGAEQEMRTRAHERSEPRPAERPVAGEAQDGERTGDGGRRIRRERILCENVVMSVSGSDDEDLASLREEARLGLHEVTAGVTRKGRVARGQNGNAQREVTLPSATCPCAKK
jgi:hypothetical protein